MMHGGSMKRTAWPFPSDTIKFNSDRQKLVADNPDKAAYQRHHNGQPAYYPTQDDMRARDWEFVP